MRPEFTCMIVDDEPDAVELLTTLIRENCPLIKIAATANGSDEAIKKYHKNHPDLLFMDIEVDRMNGFDIINEICRGKSSPQIIFVTGYNKYAVQAYKTHALGYVLNPVDKEDLIKAVDRFTSGREAELQQAKLWQFIRDYSGKIRFNTTTGFNLVHPGDILYCIADHNYTKVFTSPERFLLVSVNLAAVEEKLPSGGFQRISRSILINTNFLSSVHRRNKSCTLNWNGREIVLLASSEMLKKL